MHVGLWDSLPCRFQLYTLVSWGVNDGAVNHQCPTCSAATFFAEDDIVSFFRTMAEFANCVQFTAGEPASATTIIVSWFCLHQVHAPALMSQCKPHQLGSKQCAMPCAWTSVVDHYSSRTLICDGQMLSTHESRQTQYYTSEPPPLLCASTGPRLTVVFLVFSTVVLVVRNVL